jgi:hypothetical protein
MNMTVQLIEQTLFAPGKRWLKFTLQEGEVTQQKKKIYRIAYLKMPCNILRFDKEIRTAFFQQLKS